ncbi:MAG: PH domain-containing protein [Verrucomicrobia subdivision 3 bacterium]|nr:PH domain-containing protein [Limisphaerales bacterium]
MGDRALDERIMRLERPHASLWKYYVIRAILTGPGIVATLPYLFFRYHTLRYRFDEEGIHMRFGILFRREINLTYARIQDIHLKSGFIQRWLGLADVEVQTASGSATAEIVIEGFKEFAEIRDFLYTRMRGYQAQRVSPKAPSTPPTNNELKTLLTGIRDELRRTREALEAKMLPPPNV